MQSGHGLRLPRPCHRLKRQTACDQSLSPSAATSANRGGRLPHKGRFFTIGEWWRWDKVDKVGKWTRKMEIVPEVFGYKSYQNRWTDHFSLVLSSLSTCLRSFLVLSQPKRKKPTPVREMGRTRELEGIFFLVFLVLLVPLVPLSQRFGDYWIGVLGVRFWLGFRRTPEAMVLRNVKFWGQNI